ncbi:hypothetical protein, partial [Arthrobacter gandavensis]|uniref:hypothetical protein n=1 Tax=Arthrobacter gandavensis TaxID=169960 RepID=UPI001E481E26
INKLGTLLSSQTTGTSGLLGKPFPIRKLSFSFRTAVVFYQHIPSLCFPQFGTFAVFTRNIKMITWKNQALSQQSREPALGFVWFGHRPGVFRKAGFRRPNCGDSNYFTHPRGPVQAAGL